MCTRRSAPSSFGHEADIFDSPDHFPPLHHIKFSQMQHGICHFTQPSNVGRPFLLPSIMSIIVSILSFLLIVWPKCDSFCFATNMRHVIMVVKFDLTQTYLLATKVKVVVYSVESAPLDRSSQLGRQWR